jgi:Fur family transcriptional regulator, ferric uptake regulator
MKTRIKEQVDKLLSSAKMKRTIPRRTILEVLLIAKRPQTADEIMTAVSEGCANKVTVYRTLESLVVSGLVHKAFVGKRSQHFELADKCGEHRCHPHFVCEDCGRTNCLPGLATPIVMGLGKGFVIHRQQVRLAGLCPQCSGKAANVS